MPRIGGGGGPIIPPQTTGAQNAPQAQQTQAEKANFAEKVAQQQGTDSARAQQSKESQASQLTGKTREIAKRLKNGTITQKEATREFVGLVIEERFPELKKRKRKKKKDDDDSEDESKAPQTQEELIEEAVSELIERDPVLASQLERQFNKLAG
ncbi:MAG: hypothetical protein IPK13_07550 [Deltaproteobacteria bacterium]|nr:hypothetical protein [Deltaproteobacteria bacterium]